MAFDISILSASKPNGPAIPQQVVSIISTCAPALRNSDDKYFVQAYGVYLDLIWLNAEVGTGGGDVAGSADFAPTVAQLDSLKTLETQMAQADSDFYNLVEHELPAFNQGLDRTHHLPLTGSAAGHQP